MKLLALLLLAASCNAATIYVADNAILMIDPGRGVAAPEGYQHALHVYHESDAGRAIMDRLANDWNGHTVVGSNLYYNGELVVLPPYSPYAPIGRVVEQEWPLLADHPAPDLIPEAGMTYRLLDGTNYKWWIVRKSDVLATQVSAHDSAGNEITRTRNLRTGVERTINLRDVSERTADTTALDGVRQSLRDIKASLTNGEAQAKAIVVANTSTTAQVRSAVIDLRRELIDLYQEVQNLRKQLSKTVREVEP